MINEQFDRNSAFLEISEAFHAIFLKCEGALLVYLARKDLLFQGRVLANLRNADRRICALRRVVVVFVIHEGLVLSKL